MRIRSLLVLLSLVIVPCHIGCRGGADDGDGSASNSNGTNVETDETPSTAKPDLPDFEAAKFSNPTQINNQWLPIKPGTRMIWDGTSVDEEGDEEAHSVSFVVTDLTKEIAGVQTVVCWERDFIDGEMEEAEIVFFAQDDEGNVWHFGQYSEEISDGEIEAAPGWLHGVKDGHAGIQMPADPKVGDKSFSQGWAPSVPWTDRAVVLKTIEKVTVETGTYEDVLVFQESDSEEPDAHQLKYYARGVGNIKIGTPEDEEAQEDMELVKVEQISEEELAEAREKALALDKRANEHCKEAFAESNPSKPAG